MSRQWAEASFRGRGSQTKQQHDDVSLGGGRHRQITKRFAAMAAVALTALAVPSAARADVVPPVSDLGVTLEVAEATVTSGETPTINYLSEAEVIGGEATLLRGRLYNDGTIGQSEATLIVDLGAKADTAFTLDPACSLTSGETTDTVECTVEDLDAGEETPFFYMAARTGTDAVTSTASYVATPDGVVPLGGFINDGDETASAITGVTGSNFAFLTDGEWATFTGSHVTETFTVPLGATNGGGVFVALSQGSSPQGQQCGDTGCYEHVAVADFVQVGGDPAQASNPFTIAVTYTQVHQTCSGIGNGSGCNKIFYQHSGSTATPVEVLKCTTYAPNGATSYASDDPCLYGMSKDATGIVTHAIAAIRDISLPISNHGNAV